jgi:hypothetical protein
VPETQIAGTPNPPVCNIDTSQNHEESQLTDASGYASGSPQSFGNNHEGGFSDDQGSMEECEGEEAEGDNQDDVDADMDDPFNEHFTEAAYSHLFEERVKYFLAGNMITKTNREAVECCIIAEAGMTVSQNNSAKQKELMELIWEKYSEIIRTLDPALWSSTELHRRMYERLDGGRR